MKQVLRVSLKSVFLCELNEFNKSSIIYFIVPSCSRIGIAVGVILRMTLGNGSDDGRGQQGQQIGFIHCMSVMFPLGVVVVFVDEIKTFLNEVNSNHNTIRSKSDTTISISLAENLHVQISE